jgi:hypothetical protein
MVVCTSTCSDIMERGQTISSVPTTNVTKPQTYQPNIKVSLTESTNIKNKTQSSQLKVLNYNRVYQTFVCCCQSLALRLLVSKRESVSFSARD